MSVMVIGYRNGDTIAAAVKSVTDQLEPGVDVVVVTSGPDSGAGVIREQFPTLPIIEIGERLMPGAVRNRGVRSTTGAVVAFLEADCLARPGWVRGRRAAHARGHSAVAGSVARAGSPTPWNTASWLISYSNRLPAMPSEFVDRESPRRHGLSLERTTLLDCGGFDERLRIGEDTLLADSIAERGIPIWFEASVCIAHRGPGGPVDLVRDEFRRGRRLRSHLRSLGADHRRWRMTRRTIEKTRHTLRQGRRYGEQSPLALAATAPFVVAGVVAQLLGCR